MSWAILYSSMPRKIRYTINLPKEHRRVTVFMVTDKNANQDGITINRWFWPPIDPFMIKLNLLLQRNNDEKAWMDLFKSKSVGYQYVIRSSDVKNVYEPILREKIDLLVKGFMRKDKMDIPGLFELVSMNIDNSIVIFHQLYVESDVEKPKLLDSPIDVLTSGFMSNYKVYTVGLHGMVQKYIDRVPGMYLEWDKTVIIDKDDLKGENEWKF